MGTSEGAVHGQKRKEAKIVENMVIFGLGMLLGGFISGFVLSLVMIHRRLED